MNISTPVFLFTTHMYTDRSIYRSSICPPTYKPSHQQSKQADGSEQRHRKTTRAAQRQLTAYLTRRLHEAKFKLCHQTSPFVAA
jgi:hypothetical protein